MSSLEQRTVVVIPARNEEARIGLTLAALSFGINPLAEPIPVVVVDNDSTDRTAEIIENARSLPGLNVHQLQEKEIGPSPTADTGFRFAIEELGAKIIARTDADSVPAKGWLSALHAHHRNNPGIQLLSGPVHFGYVQPASKLQERAVEGLIVPALQKVHRAGWAIKYRSIGLLTRFAPGHNLSTTKEAYTETGGFPRSDDKILEDLSYYLRVLSTFGKSAIGFDEAMAVATSARRFRSMGITQSVLYYALKQSRANTLD